MEVIDQAQHFAALGAGGSGGGAGGDATASFREGLDGTERECKLLKVVHAMVMTVFLVFALAQDSAKQTKKWYESSDRGRR